MEDQLESSILILDDDIRILETMELVFEDRVKETLCADHPEKALEILQNESPDLLIMDMNYSKGAVDGIEGLEFLSKIHRLNIELPIIVMTAYGEVDLVVKCMKLGVVDFIQKPWSNQRLLVTVANAIRLKMSQAKVKTLEAENDYYKDQVSSSSNYGMVGSSNAMKFLRDRISRVAKSDASVLILGENGTGKELVAQAIHNESLRLDASFIKIDVGSIHEQLFEAEMFGAKKGSYTGQDREKIGRITMATNGSLFLDEIGNLPLAMQAKMLSVLQNREIIPIGSTTPTPIDVRLISATNLPINDLLDESKFRQDLLYRINTVEIQVPSLRDRLEDVPELIHHFKEIYENKYGAEKTKLGHDVIRRAQDYNWPGNVRELQHAVERAVLMCSNGTIHAVDLIPRRMKPKPSINEMDLNLERMERNLIERALRIHEGNMSKASKDLGLTRAALYRRLEKYGL